jgi:hypothetical protein
MAQSSLVAFLRFTGSRSRVMPRGTQSAVASTASSSARRRPAPTPVGAFLFPSSSTFSAFPLSSSVKLVAALHRGKGGNPKGGSCARGGGGREICRSRRGLGLGRPRLDASGGRP